MRILPPACVHLALIPALMAGVPAKPRPLSHAERADLATLLRLEDQRSFEEGTLNRLLKARHPEVRRRAVLAVARIVNPRGSLLLQGLRKDPDREILATVAFAYGQLKDPSSVPWLSSLLAGGKTPPEVAREAARSLGKLRGPEAWKALADFLLKAPPQAGPSVGEALLALGRFTTREDLAPVLRWVGSPDVETRVHATWALFRPRNPRAVPTLLKLTEDPSAEVRFWAVRGLAPALVDEAGLDRSTTGARLREALADPDRRVRTEALRTLVQYDDEASFQAVLKAQEDPDTWLSVSAAEALGRFKSRGAEVVPHLVKSLEPDRPLALRLAALGPLATLAPEAALEPALALLESPNAFARSSAMASLKRLGPQGAARLEAWSADPAHKALLPIPAPKPAPVPPRTEADYLRLVERWVVPGLAGEKPRVLWETPKGPLEIELFASEAPLAMDHLERVMASGELVGPAFGRVVPNFVVQQRPIREDITLRDEVNRLGLTRANLSWASAGLDTGRPGYTLASTPQPHNEGDFTALGRVMKGMEVVDRLELGDAFTAARWLRGPK